MAIAGLSVLQLLAASAAIAAGATVQAALGFGMGLIAAPLLALISPDLVPGPVLLSGLVVSVTVTIRGRRDIHLFGLKWGLLGRLGGTIAAVLLASMLPPRESAIVFGALVLLAVGLSAAGIHVEPTKRALVGAGSLSGFMGTLTSIGGPPMAMLYQRASGARLRATMSGYLTLGLIMSIVLLALSGGLGWREVASFLLLTPGIAVGLLASTRAKSVLDLGYVRPAVLALSAASSIAVILKQVL